MLKFKKIKEINKQGITIILVEQNAHMAMEISNKVFILENGVVAMTGGAELREKKIVKDLYLGH